jgi:ABC-2 type transport system permease protein
MSAAWAIAKRDIRTYFNSPIPYIVFTIYAVIAGFLFFSTGLLIEKQAEMRGYFAITPWLFPIVIPAITMRLLAEEKGTGTLELLVTMPVRDWELVVGKFAAALAFLVVLIGLTGVFAVSTALIGPLDKGPAFGGYLGLLFLGGAYAAVGLMASSLTRNQILAFIIGFAICFAMFLFGKLTQIMPQSLQPLVSFLSSDVHFENFSRGVIDLRDVLYYLSVMAVGLVVATLAIESRRWK